MAWMFSTAALTSCGELHVDDVDADVDEDEPENFIHHSRGLFFKGPTWAKCHLDQVGP